MQISLYLQGNELTAAERWTESDKRKPNFKNNKLWMYFRQELFVWIVLLKPKIKKTAFKRGERRQIYKRISLNKDTIQHL